MDSVMMEWVNECCDSIQCGWSSKTIEPSVLLDLKTRIQEYVAKEKDSILSLYDYANGPGKYVRIDVIPLTDGFYKYEDYHDDLLKFINAMLGERDKYKEEEAAVDHINEALGIDTKFQNSLFSDVTTGTVPAALAQLDTIMLVSAFIDKSYDTFVKLKERLNQNDVPDRLLALINLYVQSVNTFLPCVIEGLEKTICDLKLAKERNASVASADQPAAKPFKLL